MARRSKLKQGLRSLLKAQATQQLTELRSKQTPGVASNHAKRSKKVDHRKVVHRWSDGYRTLYPYRPNPEEIIVVVGDGDHSFTRSLLSTPGIPGQQLVALVWEDSLAALAKKYPTAESNLAVLQAAGVNIIWGVDATKESQLSLRHLASRMGMSINKVPRISRIVFNFPHTGEGIKDREHNIRAQQKLLLAFLTNAAKLLQAQRGPGNRSKGLLTRNTIRALNTTSEPLASELDSEDEFSFEEAGMEHSSLTPQQVEIHVTTWCGDPYDAWNIKRLATSTGSLGLVESFAFNADRYPGYHHCRTIGFVENDTTFTNRPARTFVFTLPDKSERAPNRPAPLKRKK